MLVYLPSDCKADTLLRSLRSILAKAIVSPFSMVTVDVRCHLGDEST